MADSENNNVAGSLARNPADVVPSSAVAGSLSDPTRSEVTPIDDPIQLFRAAIDTGVSNTEAQVNNFKASVASIMGNEYDMQDNLNKAQRVQAAGANYLADAETFEEFLEAPSFEGFISQAIQATGQFVPSAVASIGLAMTGAGVGAGASAVAGRAFTNEALKKGAAKYTLPKSLAEKGKTKTDLQEVVNKKIAIESAKTRNKKTALTMTPEEDNMLKQLYAKIRNERRISSAKIGGLAGAGSQEQVMGAGISFGDYAEQGMTDSDSAFASQLQGLGFTAIGLGSEVAVVKSVQNVLKKKPGGINTLKDAKLESVTSRTAKVAGVTSISEGLAEAGQEELSVQQKSRIDEEYTAANAKLDRLNALFAGFVGGMGVGAGIGAPSGIAGKTYEKTQQAFEIKQNYEYQRSKFAAEQEGRIYTESAKDLKNNFRDMANPTISRDLVWVDANSNAEFEKISTEMNSKYPNLYQVEIADVGTVFTPDSEIAESFSNVMSSNPLDTSILNDWLATNLGYTRSRRAGDNVVVEVRSPDNNFSWYQQTDMEGEEEAIKAAEAYINGAPGYTVQTQTMEKHLEDRAARTNVVKTAEPEYQTFDEYEGTESDDISFQTEQEEIVDSFTQGMKESQVFLEPVEKGRGSLDQPITPKNKSGWAAVNFSAPVELVSQARQYIPVEFEAEFDRNIADGRYSESLLKSFIKENEQETSGMVFVKINETGTNNVFNLIRHRVPGVGGLPVPPAAIKSAVDNAVRYPGNASRFRIKTPSMEKPQPVSMPTLTNHGRKLRQMYDGESLEGGKLGSALSGLSYLLGEIDAEITFEKDGKLVPFNDAVASDPGAVVYEIAEFDGEGNRVGVDRYTLSDLQTGKPKLPSDVAFANKDELIGQDLKEKQEDIQNRITDLQTEREQLQEKIDEDLLEGRATEANQKQTEVDKLDSDIQYQEGLLGIEQARDQELGLEEPIAPERAVDEFNLRVFKPYNYGPERKQGKLKTGVKFSPSVEKDLDANFLNSFDNIAKQNLKLKREYRVFSSTDNILDSIINELPVEQAPAISRLLNKTLERINQGAVDTPGKPAGTNIKKESTGLDFDIIIVQTQNPDGPMSDSLKGAMIHTVGHEIGHSFVNQELETSLKNVKLREALQAAYDKTIKEGTSQYTQTEQGFKEWMSDQVSVYLLDETLKAADQSSSFFKRLANKIKTFYNKYTDLIKRRYTSDAAFVDYVNELSGLNKNNDFKYQAKVQIEETVEKIGKTIPLGDSKTPQKLKKTITNLKESGELSGYGDFVKKILYASDDLLRSFGPAGVKLAQLFRGQPQSQEAVGILTASVTQSRAKMNQIQTILGVEKSGDLTPQKMDILYKAEDNTISTDQLPQQAKEIRQWLETHYDSIGLQDIGVGKLSNFFPRSIAITEIAGDQNKKDSLVSLLEEYNPETPKNEIVLAVEATLSDVSNEIELENNGEKYNIGLVKSRAKLYKNVPTERLRKEELIEEPHRALQKYIDNTVKRVELNKRGGPEKIAELLSEIQDPKQRELAEKAVMALLGKVSPISGGLFRGANQIGLAFNVTTLLTFATFASFPDLAGPILRSKDFSSLRTAGGVISTLINSPEEAAQLAKDIGVIGIDAMMETFVGAGELDYTSEGTKKFTNTFFRAIGLEQFTKFTRVFAAGMGKSFLLDNGKKAATGDKRSIRYLKELDLTAEEVNSWAGGNINEAGNEKIKLALARFVDESIVRPNAAERPTWASDPRFALVWQLKSFFYAYGKTVVGGSINEMQSRYTEAGLKGAAVPLFLGAATLLPLTMLGFDLRERFKVGLAWVLPGVSPEDKDYRRSLSMDWGEYTTEIIDRSGVLGPFTLALPLFIEDKRYGDPFWVGPLGPTVEKGYDLFTGDLNLKDLTPLYNNL